MLDVKHNGRTVALLATTAGYLIGSAVPALAQNVTKSPEKWRPRDGFYSIVGEGDRCELPDFDVRLRKMVMVGHESFYCKVTKLADIAEGAIRLDLSCDEDGEGGDPNDIRWSKEVMKLRKIDDKSFFMLMTKDGKFSTPEWRVRYCSKGPEIR